MKVAVSGLSGFIGRNLQKEFIRKGWEVIPIGRQELYSGGEALSGVLDKADAVVHLAGAPILHRWTKAYQQVLISSRIETTANLSRIIAGMEKPPAVFISVSAVGIYAAGEIHTEESRAFASDFLGALCKDWEAAAREAEGHTRLVIFRLGVVLDKDNGALKKMLLPFRLGLGGPTGSGKQYFSWIHIHDLARAFIFALESKIAGIYNLCAPECITNGEYSKVLASTLSTQSRIRIPAFVLKLLYGEGARVLTEGQAADPAKLMKTGFEFYHPYIKNALADLLRKNKVK